MTPSDRIPLAFSIAAVSSPACFWRAAHCVAFSVQLCLSSSRYFSSASSVVFVSESDASALWSSSVVVERVSVA